MEAGLPVFIDKPLALTVEDLRTFAQWEKAGARLLSSSGLRYAPEIVPYIEGAGRAALGELRWISGVSTKTWERYGIHLLEPIARLLGTGFDSVRLESPAAGVEIAHLTHRSGVQITLPVIADGGLRTSGDAAKAHALMESNAHIGKIVLTWRADAGQMAA